MNPSLDQILASEMATWESSGLRRRLPAGPAGADFVSNDYLGFAEHPRIVEGARAALESFGAGGKAARLLGGGSPLDAQVERSAAEWMRTEGALLFPSGYQANLGLVTCLAGRGDVILSDALNHASLIDAARLSRARVRIFGHNDLERLEALLVSSAAARRRIVVTEGIFGMDGDRAPIRELDELCQKYDAWLIVDEAHSIGVVGPGGRGACADVDLSDSSSRLAGRVITGGKALGASGGLVVASSNLVDHLLNHARTFVFTTAVSPAVAGALATSIPLVADAEPERRRLHELAQTAASGLGLAQPDSAILPFITGRGDRAQELAAKAQEAGLEVRAVRPPTVPVDTSRLRIVCHANNDETQIAKLVDVLADTRPIDLTGSSSSVQSAAPRPEPIVVVGTDTDVGKTVTSALLVRAVARHHDASYWKPVQTGTDSDTREVRRLCEGCEVQFGQPAFEFPLPASPHEAARAAGGAVDPAVIDQRFAQLDGPTIVELAGGVLVPLTDDVTQADWLERTRPSIVLVARSGLGTLNHTLLTLEALHTRGLTPRALFLVGPHHPSNRETLRPHVARLFEVPRFDELSPAALERWLDHNDLRSVLRLGASAVEV